MMNRKNIQWTKYVAAFAITIIIFLIGLSIGSLSDRTKLSSIETLEQELKMDTLGTEIQYILISESPCAYINSSELAVELGNLGSKLTFMESQLGVDDPRVLDLKEYYHLLELRHWLFNKQAKKECGIDDDLVLYFYSNAGDCKECEEQGYVLTFVRKKLENFNVYSFDVNIDNPALNTLKTRYGITTTPTIIINDKQMKGFVDKDTLMELFSDNTTVNS